MELKYFSFLCCFCILNITSKDLKKNSFDILLTKTRFNKRVQNNLRRIYNWSLLQKRKMKLPLTKKLLYPFGGGDVLYPLVFFEEIDEIIIIGLEPAGVAIKSKEKLNQMVANLWSLYELGYFRTRQMEHVASVGVLTLMYHQLMALNAQNIKSDCFHRGFVLTFELNNRKKKVTYHTLNLHDKHYTNWIEILKKHKKFTLFLKGASYILQQENFYKIRDYLVQEAEIIIQDDTGFGYKFLLNHDYKVKLFGLYWEPLQSDNFEIYFQRSLMMAYLEEEEINVFDISYNEENWLIAQKKSSLDKNK